jgi:Putative transmembrane protein (PGPGW)
MEWIRSNDALLWWLFAGSMVLLLASPISVGWVVLRLPKDYFTRAERGRSRSRMEHPLVWPFLLLAKNLLGAVMLLAGLAMLVTPGQGLLTLVIALMLIDFPGKYHLERWLVTRPRIWRSINWLRRRAGRTPLERPK